MWAFVFKLLGIPPHRAPVPVRVVKAERRQDWNGTVLSAETYR